MLTDEAVQAGQMQRRLDTQLIELFSTKKVLGEEEAALEETACQYGHSKLQFGVARTAIGRAEGIMLDFAE